MFSFQTPSTFPIQWLASAYRVALSVSDDGDERLAGSNNVELANAQSLAVIFPSLRAYTDNQHPLGLVKARCVHVLHALLTRPTITGAGNTAIAASLANRRLDQAPSTSTSTTTGDAAI